jgi:hypothetical protein
VQKSEKATNEYCSGYLSLTLGFICCYFDQEDRDCVGVHILFTLFCSDFSHGMAFCGELLRNSSWEAGMLEVSPAGDWR